MTLDTNNIITTVAKVYGITESDILGKSRKQPIAEARQMCMKILYHDYGFRGESVAKIFGCRHPNVVYASVHIADIMRTDRNARDKYGQVTEKLKTMETTI